jgi:hypothetical protein
MGGRKCRVGTGMRRANIDTHDVCIGSLFLFLLDTGFLWLFVSNWGSGILPISCQTPLTLGLTCLLKDGLYLDK